VGNLYIAVLDIGARFVKVDSFRVFVWMLNPKAILRVPRRKVDGAKDAHEEKILVFGVGCWRIPIYLIAPPNNMVVSCRRWN
jgi:hypothetical protein